MPSATVSWEKQGGALQTGYECIRFIQIEQQKKKKRVLIQVVKKASQTISYFSEEKQIVRTVY